MFTNHTYNFDNNPVVKRPDPEEGLDVGGSAPRHRASETDVKDL